MKTNFNNFSNAVNYIEDNLANEINYAVLAKTLSLSIYEFRRIFSFVAGISLYEYIKNRRLSKAAFDLKTTDKAIAEIAAKYNYDSPSSFSRAFRELFGISPTKARKQKSFIKTFPKLNISKISEDSLNIPYTIIQEEAYYIKGVSGISFPEDTVCCESVWNKYYNGNFEESLKPLSNGKLFASYFNSIDGNVSCTIGIKTKNADETFIPASCYICFSLEEVDTDYVNNIYEQIYSTLLSENGFKRLENLPNIEVFDFDGSNWEIRIPIEVSSDDD